MIADPEKAEKARRAAALQAKIAAKLDTGILKTEVNPEEELERSNKNHIRNLIFDEHGKTLDAVTGEEVHIPQFVPTLKANLRAQKAQNFKEAMEVTTQKKPVKVTTSSPYFDPRLSLKSAMRPKRTLSFYEPGKFIKIGQRMRTKAQLEKLQESVALAAKRTGIASAAKLATIQPKRSVDETVVPDVEWWDSYILKDGVESYSALDETDDASSIVNNAWITNLVEHPIKMKAPTELSKPPEIPLLLTKKERKKLRRKNRQDAQKERQELVRLGLMAPPEPKRAHEAANAARKLTKDQARHKRIRKLREDTSLRTCVAVYRVKDLSNPSHRFKVETNANQLFMTGLVALNRDCNLVVVEGGPKQQKRFKRLMLHRIKWLENKRGAVDPSKVEASATSGPCTLVWEGTVKQRAFEGMQVKVCPTELFARELFRKRDVEHYWDMAYSGAVLESVGQVVD
ncbi:unnamed protein product [Dibothriocephalus latus]|uniref:Uncharacterized protein n=1 Tax=Dibothriocephalus latus TaxID=60516 RepID=A0A3P7P6S1_DIBLA|nr:unnamed protein product [Dibothriocephalus latus]